MTLPPEKIGDKGQRFEVRWRWHEDEPGSHRVVGWSDVSADAQKMLSAIRLHPSCAEAWVHHRPPPT